MKRPLKNISEKYLTSHIRVWIRLPVLNKDNTGTGNNSSDSSFCVER
jgi:hypothetical protein